MSDHAKLSPSSRHRWALCPGSVREEAKYPEQASGAAAVDGTHTHTLLEACLKSGTPAEIHIGSTLTDHEGSFVVDKERAERVQFALDYVAERMTEHPEFVLVSETRVDPAIFFHRNDLDGTVDIQLIGDDYIEIIDYKDGMSPVSAVDNHQLEQYAAGALAMNNNRTFKTIRMTIIQPKLRLKGMTGLEWHEVDMSTLFQKFLNISDEAAATDASDAPLVPGESQCKYCRAKGGCSALSGQALAKSGIVFENIAQSAADKDPNTMSDAEILQVLEAAPLVRQMIEGVEAEAQRRLEAGQSINGIKLVEGRGSRSWTLSDEQTASVLSKMGVPKADMWKTSLVSVAQVEKLSWKKRDGTVKQLNDKQLAVLKTEYIKKSGGKLTVALASDSRPAVNLAIKFEPILPDWLS